MASMDQSTKNRLGIAASHAVKLWSTGCEVHRAEVARRLHEGGPGLSLMFMAMMMERGLDFPYTFEFDELLYQLSVVREVISNV